MGDPELINTAMILGIGIAIQNFPEGFAVAMPLSAEKVFREEKVFGTVNFRLL